MNPSVTQIKLGANQCTFLAKIDGEPRKGLNISMIEGQLRFGIADLLKTLPVQKNTKHFGAVFRPRSDCDAVSDGDFSLSLYLVNVGSDPETLARLNAWGQSMVDGLTQFFVNAPKNAKPRQPQPAPKPRSSKKSNRKSTKKPAHAASDNSIPAPRENEVQEVLLEAVEA